MIDIYSAVCIQTNRRDVSHRREIREANLNRELGLIDASCPRMGFQVYAPIKLILFPEVFMQGWHLLDPSPYSSYWEKVAKDIAIEIPGEETDLLAEKAKTYDTYIAGSAHEVIPELGTDIPLNCAFIISPSGEVIYKRHKFNSALSPIWHDDISPHDIWDKYIKVMDGKYGRKKGDILSCFFPVVDTEIGKLGYLICAEGLWFENSRSLAIQGCEVMLRSSGIVEPQGSPPQQSWEITNRSMAFYNVMYVVACSPGDYLMENNPRNATPGQSMVIDFQGAFLQHVTYPGETITSAVINIDSIRRRRMDLKYNFLPSLRTEVYREIYKKSIYPAGLCEKSLPTTSVDRIKAVPLQSFITEGIFVSPNK